LELGVILDVPLGIPNEKFLSPVSGGKSMLEILVIRMSRLVEPVAITILTGRDVDHTPYGSFCAAKGLYLHRTSDPQPIKRVMNAANGRKIRTIIRVNATNIMADPELLQAALDFHVKKNSNYTFINNLPDWLGGEIIQAGSLTDAFVLSEKEGNLNLPIRNLMESFPERITTNGFRPRIRGRWKFETLSLADPAGERNLHGLVVSTAQPETLEYKDFIA